MINRLLIKKISVFALLVSVSFIASGCDLAKNQLKMDRSGNMDLQDYRDAMAPRLPEATADAGKEDNIPSLSPYFVEDSENTKPMATVSITVNQTVPLKDVLYQLAEQADYDIEIDPRITGSIILTARDRPFDMVIDRIAEIAGLRYKFSNDSLRVELDTPIQKTYKLDYLNSVRSNESSVKNDISVDAGSEGSAGSSFSVTSKSEADFWGDLANSLQQILTTAESTGNMRTNVDPQITAAAPNPAPVEPVVSQGTGADGQPEIQVQPPQATLDVSAVPTDVSGASPDGGAQDTPASNFSISKQSGMITVFATERQHKQVANFLKQLKNAVSSQVLIEAKVLEVALSDEYAAGVNWSFLNNNRLGFQLLGPTTVDADINPIFSVEYDGNNISAIVSAVSRFGTVTALASPRLTVLNNQSAVLNVSTNQVFFELDVTAATLDANGGVSSPATYSSEAKTVPEGVIISVQPSIDMENGSVSMAVRPTITRIVDEVSDPAVSLVTNGAIISNVPVVNVQEMDSVIKMNSGQAIVMGGLMQDRADSTETGVPVLSELPYLGALFKGHVDSIRKTELIILLRATIINDEGDTLHDTDRDIYKRFSGDRRPLKL